MKRPMLTSMDLIVYWLPKTTEASPWEVSVQI